MTGSPVAGDLRPTGDRRIDPRPTCRVEPQDPRRSPVPRPPGPVHMCDLRRAAAASEPLRATCDDHAPPSGRRRRVGRIGRLRVPLAGPYRPWATLYRLPDGRALWEIRLWEYDRPVRHAVTTAALLRFARQSGLPRLAAEIEELAEGE